MIEVVTGVDVEVNKVLIEDKAIIIYGVRLLRKINTASGKEIIIKANTPITNKIFLLPIKSLTLPFLGRWWFIAFHIHLF